ncbi:MAG TPA: hypothetical protein VGJ30_00915 [Candidatus Angelobacter sp.]
MGQLVGRYIWLILLGIFSAQQELVVFSQTEWLIWARLECWIVSIETPSQTGEIAG